MNLRYPHRGGVKIQVLNSTGQIMHHLTPQDNWTYADNPTQLSFEASIPNTPCEICTLRLMRQALEWGSTYQFWTCANIKIVSQALTPDCSQRGTWANGMCQCDRLAAGSMCQYQNECDYNEDCGVNGMCRDLQATSYPKKQCYCKKGWMGKNCMTKTNWDKIDLNAGYKKRVLSTSPTYEMYYKVLEATQELEVVLKVHGSSYAAIGWRPRDATSKCQLEYPLFASKFMQAGKNGNPNPAAVQVEVDMIKKLNYPVSYPKPNVLTGTMTAAIADVLPTCNPDERQGTGTGGTGEPEPGKEEPTKEEPATEEPAKEWASTEEPSKEETSSEEGGTGIHPMDCTDMVIGMAHNDYYKVGDYYTRDRSTPIEDMYWPGGSFSLTSMIGYEENGYTMIGFRRTLASSEKTDYPITDKLYSVVWARGQEYCNYIHAPTVQLANTTHEHFYRKDELKYHGHGSQRGLVALNFLAKDTPPSMTGDCLGEYKQPSTCNGDDCIYMATWQLMVATDEIKFTIKAKQNSKKWVGIGFSKNTKMADTDVITGWVTDNGEVKIQDRWSTGYSMPKQDTKADVSNIKGTQLNGVTTLEFTRKRNTGDNEDLAFTDTQCLYMIYAVGGSYTGNNIGQHASLPIVSSDPICIRPCNTANAKSVSVFALLVTLLVAMIFLH